MKLSTLSELLQTHPNKQFRLILPNDDAVPVSFHITEVAHVQKRFIDCGGKRHRADTCQLQAWLGPDTDHRLEAGKMAKVLALAQDILPEDQDLDVEIEYEDAAISQYPVDSHAVSDTAVTLHLTTKHTDCLAKGVCLPPLPMVSGATGTACCGSSCGC